jgi:hypothetical protein
MVLTYKGSRCLAPRVAVIFALSAMTLAACHKAPPPPPVAATVAKPAAAMAPAQSLPARQPGLWSITISENDSPDVPQAQQLCLDALTDQHLGVLGNDLSGDKCKKTVSRTADGGWGIIAQCDMGTGGVDEYSGQISGDFTQDYTLKVRSQTTGAALPQMNRVTNYTVVAKHTGACAADQAPGDVVSDGVKLNLFDMAGIPHAGAKTAASAPAPMGD